MKLLLEKATRQHTRDHNARLVLQTIYDAGEISRADLARRTHLTRTTVSDVVGVLIEQGLVEEVGHAPAGVGRTPTLLSVGADARQIVAVNITASELQGAVVNLRGDIRRRARAPLADLDGDAVLTQLQPFIGGLIDTASSPLLGIGISAPGVIDTQNGIARQSVNLGWRDVPLRSILQARFSLPVYVANDGHTIALAEYMFEQHRHADNLVAIKVGHGVGAGIVLNGQLFSGDEYGAGEIGHVVVEENGLPCKCGNAGCLETVASVGSIVHRAQLLARHDSGSLLHHFAAEDGAIDFDTVLQAFHAGDPGVRQIIATIGRYLGIGVASLIAVLGVRRVVITGRIAPFGSALREAVQHEVRRRVLPTLAQATEIEVVEQRPDMVLLGTAALLLTNELGLSRLIRQAPHTSEIAA
jgi:predicted NBD/HSP70 family sugar kinase